MIEFDSPEVRPAIRGSVGTGMVCKERKGLDAPPVVSSVNRRDSSKRGNSRRARERKEQTAKRTTRGRGKEVRSSGSQQTLMWVRTQQSSCGHRYHPVSTWLLCFRLLRAATEFTAVCSWELACACCMELSVLVTRNEDHGATICIIIYVT